MTLFRTLLAKYRRWCYLREQKRRAANLRELTNLLHERDRLRKLDRLERTVVQHDAFGSN